jgi:uncharacterized membrane protein YkvA (DUF1232 family)
MNDFVRFLRALATRRYPVIPWRTLFIFLFVVVYGVDPIDLIPDFIPIIGFFDDAAMSGFLIWSIRKDIKKFLEWEVAQRETTSPQAFPQLPK